MTEKIFIISLIVFAIWYTMLPGEIFGKLGLWFSKHLPDKLHGPVYECAVCMSFWYGTIIYWLNWSSWREWILVVPASMGLNVVITHLWPEKN